MQLVRKLVSSDDHPVELLVYRMAVHRINDVGSWH
jgi:hypothetical protein